MSQEEMKVELSPERLSECQRIIAKYETKRSALLPVLYIAQDQFGYLSPAVMKYVAKLLEIPPTYVFEAVSFYFMYRRKDMGKWCLQICDNITCHMMGAEKLLKTIKEDLNLTHDDVSEDKRFSLRVVQCLGACDKAPVAQVNEDYVENLDVEKLRKLIEKLKNGAGKASVADAVTQL